MTYDPDIYDSFISLYETLITEKKERIEGLGADIKVLELQLKTIQCQKFLYSEDR